MSRFVFLDMETTGLNPDAGAEPIEVAAVVTDGAFDELDSFELVTRPSLGAVWDPEAAKMAEQSGLLAALEDAYLPGGLARATLAAFLAPHHAAGTLHLAGNSVHFDRAFLKRYWPEVEQLFHHRQVDVSSFRLVGERVTGAPGLPGKPVHRAMADVRRSIAELRYWLDALRGGLESRVATWAGKLDEPALELLDDCLDQYDAEIALSEPEAGRLKTMRAEFRAARGRR